MLSGYLVKENLTELALKFLTGSQYLQNCLQIKSTGVSLETKTKLLDKDLDELLDEYLTIQNLGKCKQIIANNFFMSRLLIKSCTFFQSVIK